MTRSRDVVLCAILLAGRAAAVSAQQPSAPWSFTCEGETRQDGESRICDRNARFVQGDLQLYADEIAWFQDEDRAIARGNITFRQGRNQINADRAEINTKTRLGTFYDATGFAENKAPQLAAAPGAFVAPQVVGENTDIYFFGAVIEKTGPRQYVLTNGGFTSCVQPTPRWDLHAGEITVNVGDHVRAWNAVFDVKGVPLLYLPFVYYPTNDEGRSTGFLLPTYGVSTVGGHQIDGQFFWAINRSHDATFMYDWYSKQGHGYGSEYRYNLGSGSGNITAHLQNQKDGLRNLKIFGTANQALPYRLRASANAQYFSSVATNQLLQTNIADFSQSRRSFGANVAGNRGHYSFNGTFERTEWFSSLVSSGLTGNSPKVSLSQSERRLFPRSPLYFRFNSEFTHFDYQIRQNDVVTDDRTLIRTDFMPVVRYPFKPSGFLTVNSSVLWRDTFYTRSQDPTTQAVVEDDLNRRYFMLQSDLVGPIFNRVWDTPDNGYAEKFKHTVEPFVSVQRTTVIDNFNRVVTAVDQTIIGGTTNYNYGVNNRLSAKRRIGLSSQSQEIASLGIRQTYYTNAQASRADTSYTTSANSTLPSKFSPIMIDTRVSPASSVSGSLQAEIDSTYLELRSITASGRHSWANGTTDLSWSQRFFIAGLQGFNAPENLYRTLTLSSTAHATNNRFGGGLQVTYDAARSVLLQQLVQAYYSPQCCGVTVQYSRRNLTGLATSPIDTKFMFSFTLAGLGSFAPMDGGLGQRPR